MEGKRKRTERKKKQSRLSPVDHWSGYDIEDFFLAGGVGEDVGEAEVEELFAIVHQAILFAAGHGEGDLISLAAAWPRDFDAPVRFLDGLDPPEYLNTKRLAHVCGWGRGVCKGKGKGKGSGVGVLVFAKRKRVRGGEDGRKRKEEGEKKEKEKEKNKIGKKEQPLETGS